jgi:hypothetical protein
MEIKKDIETIPTSDFWYDLFLGGYFNPEKMLVNIEDIEAVKEAIEILEEYEHALYESGAVEDM